MRSIPHHITGRKSAWRLSQAALLLAGIIFFAGCSPVRAQTPEPGSSPANPVGTALSPIPMFAYYYIWFDPTSWNRAKSDYPLLGKYSSNDAAVMRQHIAWAKTAGLQGFIVSWKNTPALTARLKQLVQIADEQNFKLAIIYEGLDFSRNPLPVSQVASDLDYFSTNFASDKAFNTYEKPVVIWSGTWEFTTEEIASVTQTRRNKLLILASEKNLQGYKRLADLTDGEAYYWSSVNPDTYTGYEAKLTGMAAAVHAAHGLWIAPAAAGFDARQVGGTTVVDRANGDLLRREVSTALKSNPDMVGIISWNEFSENSYIEPSEDFGMQYIQVLARINRAAVPVVAEMDSSDPLPVKLPALAGNRWAALGLLGLVGVLSLVVLGWRAWKTRK